MHGGASPNVARASRARLLASAVAEYANAMGVGGPYPVEIAGALVAVQRLQRRRPRWWVAAIAQHEEQIERAEAAELERLRGELLSAWDAAVASDSMDRGTG